jgi:hypothetical protein
MKMPDINSEEILTSWNVIKEQQKADFLDHLYDVYQPSNHCYTGLWQRFCLEEAGAYCRDMYFDRLEAVKKFMEQQQKQKENEQVRV